MTDIIEYLTWYFTNRHGIFRDLLDLVEFARDFVMYLVPQWILIFMPRYAGKCQFFRYSTEELARLKQQRSAINKIRELYSNPETAPQNGTLRFNEKVVVYTKRH
jgi:hypothetical protein